MEDSTSYWSEVVGEFLNSKRTGALAITGEWGSGKTYLYRNTITKIVECSGKKCLYVSLYSYGVSGKSLDDFLIEELSCIKDLDDTSKAGAGALLTGLFTAITSDSKNSGVISAAVMAVGGAVKKRIIDYLKDYVLCFDDLDRLTEVNFAKAWSEINYFSEFKSRKVILLLDESKLPQGSVHAITYEKNIWKDVPIRMSVADALSQSLNIVPTELARELELFKESHLLPVANALGIKNIRTLSTSLESLSRVVLYKDAIGVDVRLNNGNIALLYQVIFLASLISKLRGKKTEDHVGTIRSVCSGYYQRQLNIMMSSRNNPTPLRAEDLFIQSLPALACNSVSQFGFVADYILHDKLDVNDLKSIFTVEDNVVELSDRPICRIYERLIERTEMDQDEYLAYFKIALSAIQEPVPGVCNIKNMANIMSEFLYDSKRNGLPIEFEDLMHICELAVEKWQALIGQEGFIFESGIDEYFCFRRGLSETVKLDELIVKWNEEAEVYERKNAYIDRLQGWSEDQDLVVLRECTNDYDMPLFKYLADDEINRLLDNANGKTLGKFNTILRKRFSVSGAVQVILEERDALISLRKKFESGKGYGYRRVQFTEGCSVIDEALGYIDTLVS